MTSLDEIKKIIHSIKPQKLSVKPDGTIEITDPEASKKLRELPDFKNAPEGGDINFVCS